MKLELQNIKEVLHGKSTKIVITTHHKPDGDAMGSSLALYHYLKKLGHEVSIISPTDYPSFLNWLPGTQLVLEFTNDSQKVQCKKHVEEASLIFCLDFNRLSRINELGELVRSSKALKIMVDHHLDPEGFEDFTFWRTTACATAELIYEFIIQIGDQNKLDQTIGTCLYTGIMTDSGSFRFASTTANVHRIVANLLELGVQNHKIHENIFDSNTLKRLQFLGFCLKDKLEYFEDFRTSLIYINKQELEKYQITTGDTEGIVNFALSIEGVKLATIIIDRKDQVKLSFRSKGSFPANELAEKYFNGGGHKNAAGGNSSESLEQVVEKFKSILPLYKEELLKVE